MVRKAEPPSFPECRYADVEGLARVVLALGVIENTGGGPAFVGIFDEEALAIHPPTTLKPM